MAGSGKTSVFRDGLPLRLLHGARMFRVDAQGLSVPLDKLEYLRLVPDFIC